MDYTTIILGIILIGIGILNMKGNISSLHKYHRNRVKEEDVLPFGRMVGIGTIIVGISLIVSSFLGEFVLMIGLVIGLIPILYAMFKYNKGIF